MKYLSHFLCLILAYLWGQSLFAQQPHTPDVEGLVGEFAEHIDSSAHAHGHNLELWTWYLNRPHPSVAELHRMFEQAAREFDVPEDLLKAIGQVENNWTQIGPSIDQGWGIMHLVENGYCHTLSEAAQLLGIPPQALKDDARANIRGAAALLSEYRGDEGDRSDLLSWFDASARFSGLLHAGLRQMQAQAYFRVLREGNVSMTLWRESIVLSPHAEVSETFLAPNKAMQVQPAQYDGESRPPSAFGSTSDYGPALPNFTTCNFSSRNGISIDTYVLHWIGVGTYAGAISWFQDCNANASAHFVIRSSDGQISQVVQVADKAWHAGASGTQNNERSIGVEHEATLSNPGQWNSIPMLEASAAMACYFSNQYNIPPVQALPGIRGHNDMPGTATQCPGSPPWSTWMAMFDNADGCTNAPPTAGCMCPISTSLYPADTLTPQSSAQVAPCHFPGEYSLYNVIAGETYHWSYCPSDGGSTTVDLRINLLDHSADTVLANNCDAGCGPGGLDPKVRWTATYTGQVRLQTNRYLSSAQPCAPGPSACQNLVYWKADTVSQTGVDLITRMLTVSPPPLCLGDTLALACEVENIGTIPANSSLAAYYLSTDRMWDGGDIFLAADTLAVLAAGGTSSMSARLSLPDSTLPGTYYILYVADYATSVAESYETNNLTIVQVELASIPQIPSISFNGSLLSSSSATGNQWMLNGTPISGATSSTYLPTSTGTYTVAVTNAQGCQAISQPYSYTSTSATVATPLAWDIYPNPSEGSFQLDVQLLRTDELQAAIYATDGRLIWAQHFPPTATLSHTIRLQNPGKGMYILVLRGVHTQATRTLMIY